MPPFHMFVKPAEDHARPLFCIYLHSVTLMHILWCFIICNLFHLFIATVASFRLSRACRLLRLRCRISSAHSGANCRRSRRKMATWSTLRHKWADFDQPSQGHHYPGFSFIDFYLSWFISSETCVNKNKYHFIVLVLIFTCWLINVGDVKVNMAADTLLTTATVFLTCSIKKHCQADVIIETSRISLGF